MGCCVARTGEQRLNALIDSDLSVALRSDTFIKKLVLLGAGGSGKSTFFKQLRAIHGNGFNSDGDRLPFKKHVYHQIIQNIKRMIRFAEEMFEEDPQQYAQFKLQDDIVEQRDFIMRLRDDALLTPDIGEYIDVVWKQQALRYIFDQRAQFAIADSTSFFLNNIERVSDKSYIPTMEDVLLCRHRSIGIADKLFMIRGTQMRIFDVGGQRAERRKWIHCFEHVAAVLYVASLSGYNEFMYEDETQNVMHDSLDLFEKTCNNEWFKDTSMILFLNKSDLFADKIKSVPLSYCFPDFNDQGNNAHDASLREIKKHFKLRNHQKNRPIYMHVTCAMNNENVEDVFNDVQHLLVSSKLDSEGLL